MITQYDYQTVRVLLCTVVGSHYTTWEARVRREEDNTTETGGGSQDRTGQTRGIFTRGREDVKFAVVLGRGDGGGSWVYRFNQKCIVMLVKTVCVYIYELNLDWNNMSGLIILWIRNITSMNSVLTMCEMKKSLYKELIAKTLKGELCQTVFCCLYNQIIIWFELKLIIP